MATRNGTFTIVQISDLHCGTQFFLPNLLERAITEVNDLEPDIVVCSGDLTTFGFKEEYALAKDYLDRIDCESVVVIPGNHDSRNVGYVHFEELFGDRNSVLRVGGVTVVAVDSTEPDLDHGQIGRGRYSWIEESFAAPADLRIFVCHHHLLPVPGTGRERNIIYDAGDAIECLQRSGVNLVLSGHKHVPVCLAARGSVHRQRRNRVVPAAAREHAALLQRDRVLRDARRRLAQVPVPRPGEDHPVRGRHARVREVHGAHRGRGDLAAMTPALVVIDGEHYPPVVRDAIAELPYEVIGAWLAGGTEKLRGEPDYGVPLVEALEDGSRTPEVVVDLSDEPVLGPRERLLLASRVLARGPSLRGRRLPLRAAAVRAVSTPSLAVIGTGKRVGKTAVTGHVARLLARDRDVVVVAMGRGGPAEPELVESSADARDPCSTCRARGGTRLRTISRPLRSPASSRSAAAGAGGGLAGAVSTSNVARRAPRLRSALEPDVVVFDGSGAAIPPVDIDARILVAAEARPSRTSTRTACSSPISCSSAAGVARDVARSRRCRSSLRTCACGRSRRCGGRRRRLHDRRRADRASRRGRRERVAQPRRPRELREDLARIDADVYLVEIKAAAIDVVAEAALERGAEVVFAENEVVADGLDERSRRWPIACGARRVSHPRHSSRCRSARRISRTRRV